MKRTRFRNPAGSVRMGTWHGDSVGFGGQRWDLAAVDVLPPCEPSKVVCVGRNYVAHADETDSEVPDRPLLFLKPPNTVAAHGDTIPLLPDRDIEHEAELGVVIGEQCRHLEPGEAMDAVAGFTCVNDLSNRTDQRQETNWVRGKAFDHSAPIGPVMAPVEDVPDDTEIACRVNGETRQSSTRDRMVFDVPALLAEITTYLTLEPGDVVATGTPSGVGPLEPGDTVEVEVEGVGVLRNEIGEPVRGL